MQEDPDDVEDWQELPEADEQEEMYVDHGCHENHSCNRGVKKHSAKLVSRRERKRRRERKKSVGRWRTEYVNDFFLSN